MATPPAPVTDLLLILDRAEILLGVGEHCVGRSSECEVHLEDPLASRRHAILVVRPEGVAVRDLGSRNGILVNGEDVDVERALVEGDVVTVGSKTLTVLRICHAGDTTPDARPVGRATGRGIEPSTLGKIAVTRRAVPMNPAPAEAEVAPGPVNMGGTPMSPSHRPDSIYTPSSPAFRLIAVATARCIATGREERVEMILEAPLVEFEAALRAGLPVDEETFAIVVEQTLLLCEITHAQRWIDYLHEIFDLLRRPIPLAVVDRLMPVVERKSE